MVDPQEQDAHEQDIPTLEVDESIAPRPEEEAADIYRGEQTPSRRDEQQ
jgi:hypothetical protein